VKVSICRYALEDFPAAHAGFEEALNLARSSDCASLADHRQVAEILNNLACLCYMRGQTEKAMELLEQSMDAQNFAADKSLYAGSRFSGHTASLNSSVTKANMGVVGLVTQNLSVSIAALESALRVSPMKSIHVLVSQNWTHGNHSLVLFSQDQQLLLRDANVTLISTMEYLVVATLMSGQKEKAIQLLNRMLHMQIDAFGRKDSRCERTEAKIAALRADVGAEAAEPNGTSKAQASTSINEALQALAASGEERPGVSKETPAKRCVFRPFKSMRKKL